MMMNSFAQGAQWIRADFHLHTNADKEFKYPGDAKSYCRDYVTKMEQEGIRLGFITNHNKFCLKEYRVLHKKARKKGIALFPGVELSVNDGANGIHTLVVFSDAWLENGIDYINSFLSVAFQGKAKQQYEQENGRSTLALLDTIKTLESYQRDFFLVFAHVEEPGGLWAEMKGGRLGDLGKNVLFRRRTLGFQKVRTRDDAGKDKPCRARSQEWLKPWYPAELEGSDPKCIEQIGRGKKIYLKLGEFSFNAIKFALSDHTTRVATEPPGQKASYIRSIHFTGGVLNGQTLHFAPGLNALIGIRGSGKSAILEALRYVLDIPLGKDAQDTDYKEKLVRHTLGGGGKITLTACDQYGQEFTVSRIFLQPPDVYIANTLQPGISIRETVLRRPIYFGQKDLSSTGKDFETDLVEKLVGEKLHMLRERMEAQRQRVREAAQRWLNFSNTAELRRDYEAQLADAEFRLKKFEEYGIADKLQKRLDFQQDAATLARMQERAGNFITSLKAVIFDHEYELREATHYISKQNPDFFAACGAEFFQLIAHIEQLETIANNSHAILLQLRAHGQVFDAKQRNLQEEFAQIERQLVQDLQQTGIGSIQPDDFLTQQQRKTTAQHMLEALAKQEAQHGSIRDALFAELEKLDEIWREEFETIQNEMGRVNHNQSALRIEACFKGNKEAAIRLMRELFKGSNIRENTLRTIMDGYADFGSLLRDLPNALAKAGSTPETFQKTLMQHLGEFLCYQVPNRFVIRYRDKELKHHSLGQRASALLLYVLSQRQNDVIIIDQPEDDLDNQTIYDDVIQLLRTLKPQIQFIFATHNANFPVLGDAEQVHACRYQDDKIAVRSGSIDAQSIQDAIINIMEGGQAAFNRRKEVYTLWKPQNS